MVWLSHSQQLLFQYILEIASWDIVTLLNNLIPYSKPNMKGFPRWLSDKESACQSRRLKNSGSIPGLGRYPGKGNGNPLQHSCLGNSMDWRSLMGYSPWGCKRLRHDLVTKQQQMSFHVLVTQITLALSNILLFGCTTENLFIHLLKDI